MSSGKYFNAQSILSTAACQCKTTYIKISRFQDNCKIKSALNLEVSLLYNITNRKLYICIHYQKSILVCFNHFRKTLNYKRSQMNIKSLWFLYAERNTI